MRKKIHFAGLSLLALTLVFCQPLGFAKEHGGKEHGGTALAGKEHGKKKPAGAVTIKKKKKGLKLTPSAPHQASRPSTPPNS